MLFSTYNIREGVRRRRSLHRDSGTRPAVCKVQAGEGGFHADVLQLQRGVQAQDEATRPQAQGRRLIV